MSKFAECQDEAVSFVRFVEGCLREFLQQIVLLGTSVSFFNNKDRGALLRRKDPERHFKTPHFKGELAV